jgi:hypothetical protein
LSSLGPEDEREMRRRRENARRAGPRSGGWGEVRWRHRRRQEARCVLLRAHDEEVREARKGCCAGADGGGNAERQVKHALGGLPGGGPEGIRAARVSRWSQSVSSRARMHRGPAVRQSP